MAGRVYGVVGHGDVAGAAAKSVRYIGYHGPYCELEEKHRVDFVRIHRNALIARRAVWLNGVDELPAVSRRQLAAVRELVSR